MEKIWYIIRYSAKCNVWVLLFLSLIQPFGIGNMQEGRMVFILVETFLCFVSIIISFGIATIITGETQDKCLSIRTFVKHIAIGNAINIPLLGTLLLMYNSWHNTGNAMSYWFLDGRFVIYPLLVMCFYVGCISVFLVIGQYYHFRTDTLRRELNEVKAINQMLEQRQIDSIDNDENNGQPNTKTDTADNKAAAAPCLLKSTVGNTSLEVLPTDIIYIESMANYADVCYISGDETSHKTLRITMKQLREILSDYPYLVSCHRAFIVNINFGVAITNRSAGNYQIQLFGMDRQIPISRSNVDEIRNALKLS